MAMVGYGKRNQEAYLSERENVNYGLRINLNFTSCELNEKDSICNIYALKSLTPMALLVLIT